MADRITNIDAIRGMALLGIFLVNILAFSSVYYGSGVLPVSGRTELEAAAAFVISAAFELKFYLVFSFLFGYSVTLQVQSAEQAGGAFLPRMLRRQAGLFAIGALHAVLLFHGDILTTYALLGLLLLALRNLREVTQLRLAFGLIASTAALWLLIACLQGSEPARDDSSALRQQAEAAMAAFRGTPLQIIEQHLADLWSFLPMLLLLQFPCALAMFLLGFVSGKRRLLQRREAYAPVLDRAVCWGMLVGLPGGLIYAAATQYAQGSSVETAALALSIFTAPLFSMALVALMLKVFDSGCGEPLRDLLACAGRMALSNYLLQSLLCAFLFQGYGFGLIGRVSIVQALAIAVVIFCLQLLSSRWWLRRFRYGPLEGLLRALTVGHWPTWRTVGGDRQQ